MLIWRTSWICLLLAIVATGAAPGALAQNQPAEDQPAGGESAEVEDAGTDETGEHHDTHIGAAGYEPRVDYLRTDLAIYTFIVFLLLLAVLWKFAWKPIAAGLDKRERNVAENIDAAQRSHEEAKRLLAEYEHKLAAAQDEVRAIIDEARRDAEHTQREIIANAHKEAEAEMARGKREIEIATDAALKTMAEHMANQAVTLAGSIVHRELRPEDHNQMIQEAMDRFPNTKPSAN